MSFLFLIVLSPQHSADEPIFRRPTKRRYFTNNGNYRAISISFRGFLATVLQTKNLSGRAARLVT